MSSPTPTEDYWVRNVLSEVVASLQIDEDCDLLESQLCRDLFLESKTVNFDLLAVRALRLIIVGPFEGDNGEGRALDFETLTLRPIGKTVLGSLCEKVDPTNKNQDKENILITGGLFTANALQIFSNSLGVMPVDDTLPKPKAILETNIGDNSVLIVKNCIATGSHLAFRRAYSLREIARFQQLSDSFNFSDFTLVTGLYKGDHVRRYSPKYVLISPAKIAGIEIETHDGEIIKGEW